MNKLVALSRIVGLIIVLGLFGAAPALADRDRDDDDREEHRELVVDDDLQCPGARFRTIQEAVDAARRHGKIKVCAGTYREQLTIDKPVKIKGENGAVLVPPDPRPPLPRMTSNATNFGTGLPIAAAVLVQNTKDVTIERLTIDGTNNGIVSCDPTLVGILFQNASGEVEEVVVRKFLTASPELCGGKGGHGVFVQSGPLNPLDPLGPRGRSEVKITNSSIHHFEQSGIRGDQPGTEIRVKENVVTGRGLSPLFTTGSDPAPVFNQRGIEIAPGAAGSIEENTVVGYSFDGCSLDFCDSGAATAIEVLSANGVKISKNIVGNSQQGITVFADHSKVEGNAIFSIDVGSGILFFGNRNKAENNTITNAGTAGVLLVGDRNKVAGNKFNEAPIGVLIEDLVDPITGNVVDPSTGNIVEGNRFVNTLTPVFPGP